MQMLTRFWGAMRSRTTHPVDEVIAQSQAARARMDEGIASRKHEVEAIQNEQRAIRAKIVHRAVTDFDDDLLGPARKRA